jgi:hypothetical protein
LSTQACRKLTEDAPEFVEDFADVLARIRAGLCSNIGADFANCGRYTQASAAYTEALDNYLKIIDVESSREMLMRFTEVERAADDDLTDHVFVLLLLCGARYELLCGFPAANELKLIADACIANLYKLGGPSLSKLALLGRVHTTFNLC